jgi:hypothetical protein
VNKESFVKIAALVLLAAALQATPRAVDAVKNLPEAYSLQFENEWVRVVRVHYAPNVKLPAHTHTKHGTAYVYLNDSGPVIFRHGTDGGDVTRPPTKAGAFRLFRAVEEFHEVINTTDVPSDFLRVEFKTEPREATMLRGRFARIAAAPGEYPRQVQFENAQVRITRIMIGPGQQADVSTGAEPALVVALMPTAAMKLGDVRWISARTPLSLDHAATAAGEILRFDLKTQPVPAASLDKLQERR